MTHTAVRFVLTISDILTCMQIYPNIVDSLGGLHLILVFQSYTRRALEHFLNRFIIF